MWLAPYKGMPKAVWILTAAATVNFLGEMVLTFLFLHLTVSMGVSVLVAGRIIGLFGVGCVLGSLISVRLNERFDSRLVLIGSLLWGGVFFLILGCCKSVMSIGLGVLVLAIGTAAFRPAYNLTLCRTSSPEDHARSYSLYHIAINVALSVSALLGALRSRLPGSSCARSTPSKSLRNRRLLHRKVKGTFYGTGDS
jgi:predicted MFS family arabinose efflux permease